MKLQEKIDKGMKYYKMIRGVRPRAEKPVDTGPKVSIIIKGNSRFVLKYQIDILLLN